jgi:hypothetical protein
VKDVTVQVSLSSRVACVGPNGKANQLHPGLSPCRPRLFPRLKPKHDGPHLNIAFNLNLRRYTTAWASPL